MRKIIIICILTIIMLTGCKNKENMNTYNKIIKIKDVVSNIELDKKLVEYANGNIEVTYDAHKNFENKTINLVEKEDIIKLLNYSEIIDANYKGPSSITMKYTNENKITYEYKIWSETEFEFGQLGIECPPMNCTKFYKIKSDFNLIKYFEEKYSEEI